MKPKKTHKYKNRYEINKDKIYNNQVKKLTVEIGKEIYFNHLKRCERRKISKSINSAILSEIFIKNENGDVQKNLSYSKLKSYFIETRVFKKYGKILLTTLRKEHFKYYDFKNFHYFQDEFIINVMPERIREIILEHKIQCEADYETIKRYNKEENTE